MKGDARWVASKIQIELHPSASLFTSTLRLMGFNGQMLGLWSGLPTYFKGKSRLHFLLLSSHLIMHHRIIFQSNTSFLNETNGYQHRGANSRERFDR